MIRNKIIAVLSTFAILSSFITVANAEKTPIIKDPTFFAVLYKETATACQYKIGINYTFDGENPVTFAQSTQEGQDEFGDPIDITCYAGVGFDIIEIQFDDDTKSAISRIKQGNETLTLEGANGDTLRVVQQDYKKLMVPSEEMDEGYVFFTVNTSSKIDFACTKLTVELVDVGSTPVESPAMQNVWTYSSDESMITAGAADFLAYTSAQSGGDDDDEPVLVDVPELTGDLAKYNDGFLMQQIKKEAAATATQKIKVYSVADAEDYQVMERTVWEALGIEAADDVEAGTADISGLTVVVMVPESKAATYAQGFDFKLVD